MLPEVRPSSDVYGETLPEWFGGPIPIAGVCGDQQAATFGQACFAPGSAKNTYGTGCFMLMNTGEKPVASKNNLLTTIGWGLDGKVTYCLEGSVFIAGAVVQWLRDGLGDDREIGRRRTTCRQRAGFRRRVFRAGVRGPRCAVLGSLRPRRRSSASPAARRPRISPGRRSNRWPFKRATCFGRCKRTPGIELPELKVDGGASVNDALMQFQADMLGVRVRRPVVAETTALGAAYLAGLAVGFWKDTADIAQNWALDREFRPAMPSEQRERLYHRWQEAVKRSLGWAKE